MQLEMQALSVSSKHSIVSHCTVFPSRKVTGHSKGALTFTREVGLLFLENQRVIQTRVWCDATSVMRQCGALIEKKNVDISHHDNSRRTAAGAAAAADFAGGDADRESIGKETLTQRDMSAICERGFEKSWRLHALRIESFDKNRQKCNKFNQ
jgi:hypothetical protein